MSVVGQILGENTPSFSQEFNDTLNLMRYFRRAEERWQDRQGPTEPPGARLGSSPRQWTSGRSGTAESVRELKRALSDYEIKHGESNLTRTLNRQVSAASRGGELSRNFWFDIRTYLLFQTFRAMSSGRMNPLSGVDSILHGASLDFTLKPDSPIGSVVLKAIADVNGYDMESVISGANLAGLMGDD